MSNVEVGSLLAVVQSFSLVQFFVTLWIAAHQAFLSFTLSWSLLKLISIESVMPSNHFILCHPLLFLPSIFPSVRVFSNESALLISNKVLESVPVRQLFISGGQSINSLVLSLPYGPTLTSIHDYWKNHSFDYANLCW